MNSKAFFNQLKLFFSKKYPILIIWLILGFQVTHSRISHNAYNNYKIFKHTYFHAKDHLNLYADYPQHHLDSNHYGPIFSVIIAPFAILPDIAQIYVWQLFNILLLFFAIQQLPLDRFKKNMICLICTQELYISLGDFQTNGAIAALIVLTWCFIQERKDFWAAFCIMLGFYVKLYGIVALAFFFFSENKPRFIFSLIFWSIILFIFPMVFFTPQYILHSYSDWYHSLVHKNSINVFSPYQDVSVAGMIRRLTGNYELSSLPVLITGVLIFALPYLQMKRYKDDLFRFRMLASVLLFTVLFSSGSELVTYIIAFVGVGVWFMTLPRPLKKIEIAVFIIAIYVGSLFTTDLFPRYIKFNIMKPYGLKVLPCLIVWITIVYQMIFGSRDAQDLASPNTSNKLAQSIKA